jgi:hypothetical protein
MVVFFLWVPFGLIGAYCAFQCWRDVRRKNYILAAAGAASALILLFIAGLSLLTFLHPPVK